jgi:hypothetical protein
MRPYKRPEPHQEVIHGCVQQRECHTVLLCSELIQLLRPHFEMLQPHVHCTAISKASSWLSNAYTSEYVEIVLGAAISGAR